MQKAEVTDFHEALREHGLAEPAEQLDDVKGGGSWACTAGCTVGDGMVLESHETSIGDGAPEDRGGEGGAGGVARGTGLRVDGPGDVPTLWSDILQPSGLVHLFFAEGSGDR